MELYFDTEFTGLQKDTTLISLGIIAANNKCFYAKFTDYNQEQVDNWIQENVLDNLELSDEITLNYDVTEVEGTKDEVREALYDWLGSFGDVNFELVSDVCHYDMVLFIDIFGNAFELPDNISPCCYDINQDIYYLYNDITMQEAFDKNREELLMELTTNAPREIEKIGNEVLALGEDCKHNSLYDAIVIKALRNAIMLA